ncbi:MAG: HlyC/CorC family transporter [Alphaproteobacteria bacterium]
MEIGLLTTVIGPIIAILILLFLSAFFSGSETALTAASKVRLSSREKEGDKRAALVNKIREKKDRLLGALLLGNNLVNILASAVATSVLIKVFGEAGVVYATLVMTMLVLIFAEVLPKTYALHNAETMSMKIAPIIRVVVLLFAPVTEAVTWIVRHVLKLFGVDLFKVKTGSHLELLRGAIEMHDGPGEQTQDQRAMLRSILDLVDVDIEEIMIHRKNVVMIDADDAIADIITTALDSPYTRLPVYKDNPDNIIGIIHIKLILQQMHATKSISRITLDSVMMEPRFVPESTHLYDQLQNFRDKKEHFAVVVDEYGAFMGIVTMEDILEEIVGEIDDEHDENVAGVRKLPTAKNGDQYVIDGTVTIRDLNREFHWDLPDEDYATIAGLVIHESQMIPDMGQSFVFHGFRFDIIRRQRNQITKIRVTPPKATSPD